MIYILGIYRRYILFFNCLSEYLHFAKDCLLTALAKSRLALGSPGCFVVCLFVRHKKMVADCILMIKAIGELFFRPDQIGPGKRNHWFSQPTLGLL